jgi:hypothetical protein
MPPVRKPLTTRRDLSALAAIRAAPTKQYAARSNQPSPAPSPPPSAWDHIKLQTSFGLGDMLRA